MDEHARGRFGRDMVAAQEESASAVLPPRFWEARGHIRSGIAQAANAGIGDATLAAVLFSEALPRMVDLYGPDWVAAMLTRLSGEISVGHAPMTRRQ
jgi:hypothetical protein